MFDGGGERSDLEGKRAAEEQLYAIPTAQPTFRCAPESLGPMQTGAPKASVSLESFVAQARALTMLANKSVVPPKDRSADAGATGVILVPSYASWYKMNEIHSLERKAMSEWFTGTCTSKTPQSYVEARDLIVKLFRESPNRYLTATECRRHLAVDVCAVLRLHNFLEHWGLINYNVPTNQRPVARGPMDTAGLPVLIALPNGTLVPKDVMSAGGSIDALASSAAKNLVPASNSATHPNIFHTGASQPAASEAEIRCTVTGEVCTKDRYHCIQKPELVISPATYNAEEWPAGYSAIHFVRVRAGASGIDMPPGTVAVSDWTDTEVLRLLEGLEQHGEDWERVAAHVSTKTKEQCIMQFLRLPIEDRYLDEQDRAAGAAKETNCDTFRESSHVMAQVAFLCQSMSPEVANKATQAAMNVLLKAEPQGEADPSHGGESDADEKEKEGADSAKREGDLRQKAAHATALAAAALKARSIALTEEKEIQRLISQVLKRQMTKLQSKLSNFEKLEDLLQQERESLRRQRAALGSGGGGQ